MTELSIIVPVYNGEKYLGELLDSLLAVQHIEIEIIVVDDGSTDGSRNVVARYGEEKIKYHYKENGGIVSARNAGLSFAKGKMLLFTDQDDKVDPAVIEAVYHRAVKENADIAFFSTERFTDSGECAPCDTVYEECVLEEKDIGDRLLRKLITRRENGRECISYIGHLWAAMMKRSLIEANGICFRVYMSIEDDLLFILDTLDKAQRAVTCRGTGYYWRCNPSSRTFSGKYVKNFIAKMLPYYEYRTRILVKHQVCTEVEMQQYLIGMRQEQILNIYNNECLPDNRDMARSYREIKAFVQQQEYREALKCQPECPLACRSRMEMRLLAGGCVGMVFIYKKLQIYKRYVVNLIRRQVE